MTRLAATLLALAALAVLSGAGAEAAEPAPSAMVQVPGGEVALLFPVEGEDLVTVAPFAIDATPVTNAQFLAFVRAHPEWARGAVPRVFAGEAYLAHLGDDGGRGAAYPDAPVTNVHWFAPAPCCHA